MCGNSHSMHIGNYGDEEDIKSTVSGLVSQSLKHMIGFKMHPDHVTAIQEHQDAFFRTDMTVGSGRKIIRDLLELPHADIGKIAAVLESKKHIFLCEHGLDTASASSAVQDVPPEEEEGHHLFSQISLSGKQKTSIVQTIILCKTAKNIGKLANLLERHQGILFESDSNKNQFHVMVRALSHLCKKSVSDEKRDAIVLNCQAIFHAVFGQQLVGQDWVHICCVMSRKRGLSGDIPGYVPEHIIGCAEVLSFRQTPLFPGGPSVDGMHTLERLERESGIRHILEALLDLSLESLAVLVEHKEVLFPEILEQVGFINECTSAIGVFSEMSTEKLVAIHEAAKSLGLETISREEKSYVFWRLSKMSPEHVRYLATIQERFPTVFLGKDGRELTPESNLRLLKTLFILPPDHVKLILTHAKIFIPPYLSVSERIEVLQVLRGFSLDHLEVIIEFNPDFFAQEMETKQRLGILRMLKRLEDPVLRSVVPFLDVFFNPERLMHSYDINVDYTPKVLNDLAPEQIEVFATHAPYFLASDARQGTLNSLLQTIKEKTVEEICDFAEVISGFHDRIFMDSGKRGGYFFDERNPGSEIVVSLFKLSHEEAADFLQFFYTAYLPFFEEKWALMGQKVWLTPYEEVRLLGKLSQFSSEQREVMWECRDMLFSNTTNFRQLDFAIDRLKHKSVEEIRKFSKKS